MAHQEDKDFTTKVVVVLSALVLLATVVFLVTRLFSFAERVAEPAVVVDPASVQERIQPIGRVATTAVTDEVPDDAVRRSGAEVYQAVCAACHDTGAADAPVKGDEGVWGERLGQGLDTVVRHAIEGIGAMPARGGNPNLSDEEVRASVVYLLEQSGHPVDDEELDVADAEAEAEADPETMAGDPTAGQSKYGVCIGCHGAQGQGMGIFPKLAGTPADRIVELLNKYRAGEQVGPNTALMVPNARNLSDEDIADLAAYIETL
ncbi:cytochrome c class I [Thioalkalivibrio denitrificans]|uniref:Cytochrome c class I n=1 Tax=Thioalkalivibrio denitrificans TaxID=108003 RepID=A0A1V3NAH1_9GAMM|nr:cytochrome c class I [Thioalkalivibrio denitrificans]